MKNIENQRCCNHAEREAVACCLECGRFFCRECITEYENRVVCAACLKKIAKTFIARKSSFKIVLAAAQFLLGFFMLWLMFYLLGRSLSRIPSSFHEGTLWKQAWWQQE